MKQADTLATNHEKTMQTKNTPPTQPDPQQPDGKGLDDAICSAVPEDVAREIRNTWKAAREAGGEMQAFRIIERMVDRLGYGRTENNPPLLPNANAHPPEGRVTLPSTKQNHERHTNTDD